MKQDRIEKEIESLCIWIQEIVKKAGAKGVAIGNSGGKDSATVLAIAKRALGKENVLAVSMPCHSIEKDGKDAILVAETLGIQNVTVNITSMYEELKREIQTSQQGELSNEATINIRPRLRMTTLYAMAQTKGYLVMGTGNLCERMVGYTTKWGDNSSDLNPIANFTVEEVKEIGNYLGVPEEIMEKAPSDGLSGMTDEEKMGITYEQITSYIQTGETETKAKEEIEKRFLNSKHKREPIPYYPVERINYLEEKSKNGT